MSSEEFETVASCMLRRDLAKISRLTRNRLFHSFFGTSSQICSVLWDYIDPYNTIGKKYKNVSPKHLLWALMFLKVYGTEDIHSTLAGGVDPKTFRKWCWIFIDYIGNLHVKLVSNDMFTILIDYVNFSAFLSFQIRWEQRYVGDVGNECLVSVDCTDCKIREPGPYARKASKVWFSFKFKGPGLRYEIGINILSGLMVWVGGPTCLVHGRIQRFLVVASQNGT